MNAAQHARVHFKPKFDKIVELLLYLSHKRPNADKYQAVKFFYLADKLHLNRYGRPITFEVYFALPYGPVASHAMDLLEGDAKTMGLARIKRLPFETQNLDKIIYIRGPLRSVNHDLFSKSDLKIFDEVLADYGHMTFDELYKITHSHFAYKNAWNHKPDGAKRALMRYEDMIDESPTKSRVVEELESVASHM